MSRIVKLTRRVLLVTFLATAMSVAGNAQVPAGDVDQQFAAFEGQFLECLKVLLRRCGHFDVGGPKRLCFEEVHRSVSLQRRGQHRITVAVSVPGHAFPAPFAKVTTASIDPIPCDADKLMGCNSDCHLDIGCAIAKGLCEAEPKQPRKALARPKRLLNKPFLTN